MYLFEEINSPHVGESVRKGYVDISDHMFKKYQLFEVKGDPHGQRLELWLNKDFDDLNSVGCHATLYDSEENIVSEDDAALPVGTIIGLEMSSWDDARNAVDALNYGFIEGPLSFFGQIYQPISAPVMYFGAVTDSDSIDVMKDYLKDVDNIKSTLIRDQYIRIDNESVYSFRNSNIRDFLKDYSFSSDRCLYGSIFARNSEGVYPEFYLTGERISNSLHDCIKYVAADDFSYSPELFADVPEFDMARERVSANDTSFSDSDERENLRKNIVNATYDRGSYRSRGSYASFDGNISKMGNLDIVMGVPGTDISAVCRSLSGQHHSHIIDENYIQEGLPEYDDGWGFDSVHEECKQIEDRIFDKCLASYENMILAVTDFASKSDYDRLCSLINKAKEFRYHISLSYLSCDRKTILNRNIQEFISGEERFIDPDRFIQDYFPADTDLAEMVYKSVMENRDVNEYHKYNNNVRLDENSEPTESGLKSVIYSNHSQIQVTDSNIITNRKKDQSEDIMIRPVRKFHK